MRSRCAAAVVLACAAGAPVVGCGSPDNVVYGGVNSADKTTFPDAFIPSVHSAIHYNGLVTNVNSPAGTAPMQRSVVILSGQDGLCASLQASPDYFKSAPQGFTALILMTPQGLDGDFLLQASPPTDATLITSFRGGPVALLPGTAGDVSVSEFNLTGNAKGSFNLVVAATNAGYPIYGRFKTNSCAAIASAYLPLQR